jgi:hypothetical protein
MLRPIAFSREASPVQRKKWNTVDYRGYALKDVWETKRNSSKQGLSQQDFEVQRQRPRDKVTGFVGRDFDGENMPDVNDKDGWMQVKCLNVSEV